MTIAARENWNTCTQSHFLETIGYIVLVLYEVLAKPGDENGK